MRRAGQGTPTLRNCILELLERRTLFSNGASAIPALNSDPSAAVQIYLNFAGDVTPQWASFQPGTTPAFTVGNSPPFSAIDLATINEIWSRVSEDFSPFNINVTTVQPADMSHGHALEVVIGGAGSWMQNDPENGAAFTNSFTNPSLPNKVFVFSAELTDSLASDCADAIAHQCGHAFGLHDQAYFRYGEKVLNTGTSGAAPIMGVAYEAARGVWWDGPRANGVNEDELAILSGPTNGFGYKDDSSAHDISTASPRPQRRPMNSAPPAS